MGIFISVVIGLIFGSAFGYLLFLREFDDQKARVLNYEFNSFLLACFFLLFCILGYSWESLSITGSMYIAWMVAKIAVAEYFSNSHNFSQRSK